MNSYYINSSQIWFRFLLRSPFRLFFFTPPTHDTVSVDPRCEPRGPKGRASSRHLISHDSLQENSTIEIFKNVWRISALVSHFGA